MIPSLEIGGGAEKNAYNLGLRLSEKYDIQYLKFYNFENEYDVGKNVIAITKNMEKVGLIG